MEKIALPLEKSTLWEKIARRIVSLTTYIPHLKTRLNILFNQRVLDINICGKGRFNQKVIFFGLGKVIIGKNYSFGYRYGGGYNGALCEIQPRTPDSTIIIGENIATNNGVFICAAKKIVIGNNCLIGQGVVILDHDAHGIHPDERRTSIGNIKPIDIGDDVWIGSGVFILPGTKIGNNCIVGAGSIVKGEFPDNVIIAGNPAKIIKQLATSPIKNNF